MVTETNLVLIVLLGCVGIVCRYLVDSTLGSWNEGFPVSTLLINLVGSFLAGIIYALSVQKQISSNLQMGLLVGFCGGFTTFSAFALQTVAMIERGRFLPAILYFLMSPALGLLAALVPVFWARKFFS